MGTESWVRTDFEIIEGSDQKENVIACRDDVFSQKFEFWINPTLCIDCSKDLGEIIPAKHRLQNT
jgi:hypothetical protein